MLATVALWVGLITGLVTFAIWLIHLWRVSSSKAGSLVRRWPFRIKKADEQRPWIAFRDTVPTVRELRAIVRHARKLACDWAGDDVELSGMQFNQTYDGERVTTSAVVSFASPVRGESVYVHLPEARVEARLPNSARVFGHQPDGVTSWREGWKAAIQALARDIASDSAFLFAEFYPNTDRLAIMLLPLAGEERRMKLQRGLLTEHGSTVWPV